MGRVARGGGRGGKFRAVCGVPSPTGKLHHAGEDVDWAPTAGRSALGAEAYNEGSAESRGAKYRGGAPRRGSMGWVGSCCTSSFCLELWMGKAQDLFQVNDWANQGRSQPYLLIDSTDNLISVLSFGLLEHSRDALAAAQQPRASMPQRQAARQCHRHRRVLPSPTRGHQSRLPSRAVQGPLAPPPWHPAPTSENSCDPDPDRCSRGTGHLSLFPSPEGGGDLKGCTLERECFSLPSVWWVGTLQSWPHHFQTSLLVLSNGPSTCSLILPSEGCGREGALLAPGYLRREPFLCLFLGH